MDAEEAGDDAQSTLANLTSLTFAHEFPWATFLCGCGLLVTLVADKFATVMSSRTNMDIPMTCCGVPPGPGIHRQLSGGGGGVEMAYHQVGGVGSGGGGGGGVHHPHHVHGSDNEEETGGTRASGKRATRGAPRQARSRRRCLPRTDPPTGCRYYLPGGRRSRRCRSSRRC
jgi:hypothetical protein